ncbi:MAG: phenylacetate-CoA oxygenase subunit PaaI [Acidimicrobiales bacterium]|nr:phenylacetate-CoA oxygenase subunit PaaI [Acidimicrobiales bacterium]
MSPDETAKEFVLAFADDELCVGQNHSWWIAVGPFLEEDLAFSSIAQDELGHARALYSLVSNDVDRVAYGRSHSEYRSAHLAELLCHDWTMALARHVLHDLAEEIRWTALLNSSWPELKAVATRALAEEQFHIHHGVSLARRLLSSPDGYMRLAPVLCELAPLGREYFAGSDVGLVASGVVNASLADQERTWMERVEGVFDEFELSIDWGATRPAQGRAGVRSEDFLTLHDEMVAVLRIDPLATW